MDDHSTHEVDVYWGIADLSREFGITPRAIRFYEDKGLLQPERQGQRRVYSTRERVRLQLITRGKRLGFSLDGIREMIDLYDQDPTEVAQLQLFLDNIRERRSQLKQQLVDISETLAELDQLEVQSLELLRQKQSE